MATLNRYSGNFPPGYTTLVSCSLISTRLATYMQFAGIKDNSYYFSQIKRIVPIGFTDCDSAMWRDIP